MNSHQIDVVAETIIRARREQHCADAQALAGALTTPEEAYAVQAKVASAFDWQTSGAGFWKSGGPSRQARLTHAQLPVDGVWNSPAQAGSWNFTWRGIEAEIALRLGRPVDAAEAAALDGEGASALIDAMAVSIEVVDSRWRQYTDAPALLKLADLQAHGALVLGEWIPYQPRDWASQRCRVRIGAQDFESRGTHALGDPAFGLVDWLRHATREGRYVEAGTVVTTGTWVGILPASAGDLVTVEFDGVGRASIQF